MNGDKTYPLETCRSKTTFSAGFFLLRFKDDKIGANRGLTNHHPFIRVVS
jgi:hypothetical protein